MKRFTVFFFIMILAVPQGICWIYPEHRDIMILAIHKLDSVRRAEFQSLWLKARTGREGRLSKWPADTGISQGTTYLDYASFTAIGGDHSTCAADMVHTVLVTDWILKVQDVAIQLKAGLATSRNRAERLNHLKDSDMRLLKADPDYVTRAGANNVHFMLARNDVSTDMMQYMRDCLKEGAELSSPGAYVTYHYMALQKACTYAINPSGENSEDLLFAALADEAFALHFLEDMFAAGHITGTWGNAAQRKGTHDYYDEKGIEVSTWEGKHIVLLGDAFMRPVDADLTSATVLKSLEQIIDAASGKFSYLLASGIHPAASPDTFNVAKTVVMPLYKSDSLATPLFADIFRETAMPALAKGDGELPRFRAEIGPFIGLSGAASAIFVFNGFEKNQNTAGAISGVDMNLRFGLGLEGVLNEASDGAVFVEVGYMLDGSSTMKLSTSPNIDEYGTIVSAIPSRNGLHFRIRMPFYIIPGDLLVVAPILYLISPKAASSMIATAGNGGLIPWQTGMLTSIGRFQFVLGREAGVYLYGSSRNPDNFIVPVTINGKEEKAVISFHSVKLEFPIVEYRPFHTFSSTQTADLKIQLFGGVDIPYNVDLVTPDNIPTPTVRSIPMVGLRIVFDWHYYFPGKKS